jgi:hypothetical protein
MNEVEIYNTIRSEIITNHVLMHLTTLVVVAILFAGTWLTQDRKSVMSVFLPLLSLSWAAAILRFDLFIHRQGAYLRIVEARLQGLSVSIPLWETWKASLRSTGVIVPFADFLVILVIFVPTVYLLFGPAQDYFSLKLWRGAKLYAWAVSIIFVLILSCLPFIPKIAGQ